MAATTVIGLFDKKDQADSVIRDLMDGGFPRDRIQMKETSEAAREHMERRGIMGGMKDFLSDLGLMSREQRQQGLGGELDYLVIVDTDDEQAAEHAADIMNSGGAANIDERLAKASIGGTEERPGVGGVAPEVQAAAPEEKGVAASGKAVSAGERTIPEVEEEMRVGKRPVTRGGVRIYTRPTERTVEQPVTLKEEEIHVERRPVDRPATEREMEGFKEEAFEVRTQGEEAVVGKEARVKEEVTIGKEAKERTEVIRETLRGTKVEVEPLSPDEESRFTGLEPEFRSDYELHYSDRGLTYSEVLPVYKYGYHLGQNPRFQLDDWSDVEPKAKEDWEEHHYGEWDLYKEAVHTGWERAVHH